MAESNPCSPVPIQPSADQKKFAELRKNDAVAHKSSIGYDLLDDPLRRELETCTSIAGVVSVLNVRSKNFEAFQKSGHKFWTVMDFIGQMLNIVIETGGEAAAATSAPGGKAVFVAVGRLLQAARGVKEAYDVIGKIFGKLECFFQRLEAYLRSPIPITLQLKYIFVQMLAEVLRFTGVLTKYINDTAGKTRTNRVKKAILFRHRKRNSAGQEAEQTEFLVNLPSLPSRSLAVS